MNSPAPLPVVIVGGGGHARVLADALIAAGRRVLGFTALEQGADLAPGVAWLGDDGALAQHPPAQLELANGVGSAGTVVARRQAFERLRTEGFRFGTITHPAAIVSGLGVELGHGCQLLAGSLIGPHAQLGDNVLVNSRAVVEHDCRIGAHSHVATGAVLCGGCVVGAGVHIGAGATVIQGITIGTGAIIAAGAVVTQNVEPLTLVVGVPARPKRALDE